MKIRISYFYQIRNFTKEMIPISTAIWDPKWFHDSQGHQHVFVDKRGIINGLRCEAIITKAQADGLCPCKEKNPNNCNFIKEYRKNLEEIDFDKMIKDFYTLAEGYKELKKLDKEPIIVLIVYETPQNPCSERQPLIDYFNSHGIECKELEYPIEQESIPIGLFEF